MDPRLLCTLALAALLPAPLAAQDAPAAPNATPAPRTAEAQQLLNEKLVLFCARPRPHPDQIEALLHAGADPNAKVQPVGLSQARSAMHLAAAAGHARILRLLLAHGGNPRLADGNEHQTPLFCAVMLKKYLCAKLLLEATTWTAEELAYNFKMAVAQHCQPLADLLLAHGADPNALLFDSSTSLPAVYQAPRGEACLRYLIRKGLRLREPSSELIQDAQGIIVCGSQGCLDILLDAGFDLNARDADGHSLLVAAVSLGLKDKVIYLLSRGADPRTTDCYGLPPEAGAPLGSDIPELLREHAARLNAEGRPLLPALPALNMSPLLRAVAEGDTERARRLLAEGASANEMLEQTGKPALFLAIIRRDEPMARLLLEHGADIWQKGARNLQPIGQAIAAEGWGKDTRFSKLLWPQDLTALTPEQLETLAAACASTGANARLQQLLDSGLLDISGTTGSNLIIQATISGQDETVSLLLKAGADPFEPWYFGTYSAYDLSERHPEIRALFESARGMLKRP